LWYKGGSVAKKEPLVQTGRIPAGARGSFFRVVLLGVRQV
jgi:hypothetical protein